MIAYIEALEALAASGSMTKAALRLRVTQSAITKRIQSLEAFCKQKLVAKVGRGIELTSAGYQLLNKVNPALADIRLALQDNLLESKDAHTHLTMGVSESLLSSWGASVLRKAERSEPGLVLTLHTHRGPVVTERVASGEYMLGLVAGHVADQSGLTVKTIAREAMVLVHPEKLKGHPSKVEILPMITIEERSGTWESIKRQARKAELNPSLRLESFFGVASMALAGYGTGLIPKGVADTLKIHPKRCTQLADVTRPINIVARNSTMARGVIESFCKELELAVASEQ